MYILLPPSEGKSSEPGSTSYTEACAAQVDDTLGVLRHLKRLKAGERMKFYGASTPEKTKAAHALNLSALEAPGLPAIERYTGVVYTHIEPGTLPRKAAAGKRLLIVSGLFGLIAGCTPIPEYKLPMNPWLAKYWRETNTARLATLAQDKPVLDLLSQTYRKAVDYPALVTVDFRVQGGKKPAGHFGKAIKGRFVRWLLENNVRNVKDFDGFTEDGYRFDGANFVQD